MQLYAHRCMYSTLLKMLCNPCVHQCKPTAGDATVLLLLLALLVPQLLPLLKATATSQGFVQRMLG